MRLANQTVSHFERITPAQFQNEIVPVYKPAILKGLVKHWPAVQIAQQSTEKILHYLSTFDSGKPANALLMRPEMHGRIFYDDNMQGFNYLHNQLPITALINQLWRYSQLSTSPGLAVQSALISECLPGLIAALPMHLLPTTISPRIWLGNQVTTPAHFDESNNIACVIAGKRRFTLFPPEQIANLYIGPIDFAPTGTPISLVNFSNPDYVQHPRFVTAMESALIVDLEPGDALYIPSLWWHHVQSLDSINALVNYWWLGECHNHLPHRTALPLLHQSIKDLAPLPQSQREAWRAIFDYYVFQSTEQTHAHIPEHLLGALKR